MRLREKGLLINVITCQENKGNKLNKGTLINGKGTINKYSSTGALIRSDNCITGEK